jgi:hypothetical protein
VFVPRLWRTLETIAWTLAFALAYAQSPLYTSNQNQYFLHGLARAGVGFLRDDWLAHTADPTPLFSLMVQFVASAFPAWVFHLLYAALMGVYLFSLAGVVSTVFDLGSPSRRRLLLAALVVLHSAAFRYLLAHLWLPDAEFILEGGVAGQRLLGAVLQPSSFGVLLVLSLALFLQGRRVASVVSLGLAAAVHPTYLLSAGVLLATFVGLTAWRRDGRREAVTMAFVGGAILVPVAAWAYFTFRPVGADLYARAADILIRLRLPHHAIPIKWLDATVAVQAVLVVGTLVLVRRSSLFVILLAGTLFVLVSTVVQMASGNPTLALLFPWRLSTVLVPVSTACLAAAAVVAVAGRLESHPGAWRAFLVAAYAAVALAAAVGVYRFRTELVAQRVDASGPMTAFVARTVAPGQVYFVDPKLQDFRLRSGAPIVVDAKAIPYRSQEVTAWYDRLTLARYFFRRRTGKISCGVVAAAQQEYGATHVVMGPEQIGLTCPQFEETYNDGAYAVYRLP